MTLKLDHFFTVKVLFPAGSIDFRYLHGQCLKLKKGKETVDLEEKSLLTQLAEFHSAHAGVKSSQMTVKQRLSQIS